ncbi:MULTISPECIES: membrane-targeted effector domain-containing toxin [Pseudomonas]|uniref:membrane-targeted effector domain-containing toxin n=1 Tax=Pseudomonas TaxID=286 RepID=UPI001C0A8B33|nr:MULTISPECIES: membrane-targeted effector domain-containing toxin [Pseudomonas]MCK3839634.1 type III effector protein, HopAC1 family [Pseudomonas sp. NCIMB 10586]VCU67084.1 type III effector protein, HopAC1 family [Pseudomonas synxantha]
MTSNTRQLQHINHFVRKVLADFPVPSAIAAQLLCEHLQPFTQEQLDPDTTFLTTLEYNLDNPNAPYTAVIVQSMSLTEAMICNAPHAPGGMINNTGFSTIAPYFNIVDELPRLMDNRIPQMFNEEFITSGWIPPRRYEALYRQSEPQAYDPTTQLEIAPAVLRKVIDSSNFEQTYDKAITQFWGEHRDNYTTLMRIAFAKAYLNQYEEFTLTEAERQLAARAAGIGVDRDASNLTLEDFQAPYSPDKNLSVRVLRIHQFDATDILTITDTQSQITLLYVPGNSSPIHGFNSPTDMRNALVKVAKDPTQRKALTNHFEPDSIDSGLIYCGVEEALIGMAMYPESSSPAGFFNSLLRNGYWDPEQYINNPMYPALRSNPFAFIARQIRSRIAKLAAKTVVSPLDTFKADTLDALDKACLLAIPVALTMGTALLAEFCFITSGLTGMAIGADDVLKDKPHAVERMVFGALNALPVVIHGISKGASSLEALRPVLGPATRAEEGQINVKVITQASAQTETRPLVAATSPSGLQTVKIQGETFLTYKSPNDWGSFELFVNNPEAPEKTQATGLYAIQSSDLQWRRAGLTGGGAFRNAWQRVYKLFDSTQQLSFFSAYQMPAPVRETVVQMLTDTSSFSEDFEPFGMDAQSISNARRLFFEKRSQLNQDSAIFFHHLPYSPLQPVLPRLSLNESQQSIIEKLLRASDGLVIGESHSAESSKAFLIDNMQILASQGVKRIYFEHLLTDVHIPMLKAFYRSKNAPMAEALTNFLNGIYPLPRNHYYSFTNVVTKAREAGIKIQPIDCTVSYILRDMRDSAGTLRQRMMNYYATEVIQWIQTSKRQPGKWVALVGDTHTNTFKDIPGLAELTGSIGLRIEDRMGTHPLGIEVDPGRTASLGLNKGEGTVKANLVLRVDPAALQHSMESQPGPSHSRVVKSAQALLTRPGQFMLTEATHIDYRSRRGDLRSFRINSQEGRNSINVVGWPIDEKPFDNIEALVSELKTLPGLEQVYG